MSGKKIEIQSHYHLSKYQVYIIYFYNFDAPVHKQVVVYARQTSVE